MGLVGLAVVAMAVLVVKAQVVVGRRHVRSNMFEGSKVLVIASMAADAMVATKQILVKHKDWVLDHHC